ncbi:MAG: ATP-binding cassette domain-containing protein [Paracoccaceae bacterium]
MRDLAPLARGTSLLPMRADGVRLDAADGTRLLDGIDLTLSSRGVTMLMGPNGAGKSLLLKALHGLVDPSAGRVTWGGAPISDAVRRRQALVFQPPVLLRRSVAANIDFVLAARGRRDADRRDALLAHVGLAGHARRPARRLSGGERQRLALARALALEPEVMLLDEPTASLDPASTAAIEAIVREAAADGVKIVFVTHDVGQARRLAQDVAFLDRGRLVEHAPAARFFDAPRSAAARAYLAGRLVL